MPVLPNPAELAEVDQWLLDDKALDGPRPIWNPSSYEGELQTTWIINDSLGIGTGALRFSCRTDRSDPSVTVTFRNRLIWRTDVVDLGECKPNPFAAIRLGLPSMVCGPHHHAWPDNRIHVAANGFGKLPIRRPLSQQVRRLSQALLELASEINLTLDAEQRGFDVPPSADLFGMN